jgi:hypothetical protein
MDARWLVGPLFARWRILLFVKPYRFEVWGDRVSFIFQNQGPAAIGNQYPTVLAQAGLRHDEPSIVTRQSALAGGVNR